MVLYNHCGRYGGSWDEEHADYEKELRFELPENVSLYKTFNERSLECERGLELFPDNLKEIGFGNYHKISPKINAMIVMEYFANAKFPFENPTYVRGKEIIINEDVINSIYGMNDELLRRFDWGEHEMYEPPLRTIYDEIAMEPGKFDHLREERFPMMHIREIMPIYKAWHHFVSTRLVTGPDIYSVTREQAILMYQLQHRIVINPGRIIMRGLVNYITYPFRSMPYGGLITDICLSNEVEQLEIDEIIPRNDPITESSMFYYEEGDTNYVEGGQYESILDLEDDEIYPAVEEIEEEKDEEQVTDESYVPTPPETPN